MRTLLLDTNVVSEATRPKPDPRVVRRLAETEATAALAATTWHELRYGVERLPAGRRREALASLLNSLVHRYPILPYDTRAADWHGVQRARLERSGVRVSAADGQIAATAVTNGLTLVTRNLGDFADFTGLTTQNWWMDPAF